MNLTTALLLLMSTCSGLPDELAGSLAGEIAERGVRRVGVVPRALVRSSGDDAIAEDLGPKAELIAQDVAQALVDQTGKGPLKGKFAVVSHRVMREAFAELSANSLGSVKALRAVGEETRADSLLVVFAEDTGKSIDLKFELVPVSGDSAPSVDSQNSAVKTLSDLAYMGHSFEAQRWVKDRLVPVGLKGPVDTASLRDLPVTQLNPNQPHPLQTEEFPYGIEIVVPGREVRAGPIGRELFVELQDGDAYEIRMWNTGPRPVYMGLYVDGINTIGKQLEGPADTPANRMWFLKPSSKPYTIKGYLTIGQAGQTNQTTEAFLVTQAAKSLAARSGFGDRLGLITAVVYDFVPRENQKAIPRIGTTTGKKENIEIKEWGVGTRGVMLAAMTVHYATRAEIEAQLAQSGNQDGRPQPVTPRPNGAGKPSGSSAEQAFLPGRTPPRPPVNTAPNETPDSPVGRGESNEPDESVPFPRETAVAAGQTDS